MKFLQETTTTGVFINRMIIEVNDDFIGVNKDLCFGEPGGIFYTTDGEKFRMKNSRKHFKLVETNDYKKFYQDGKEVRIPAHFPIKANGLDLVWRNKKCVILQLYKIPGMIGDWAGEA